MGAYGLDDYVVKNLGESLQNNKLLQAVLKEMRDTAFTKWVATSPSDTVAREQSWYEYNAVDQLGTMIDNAVAESAEATDPQEKK